FVSVLLLWLVLLFVHKLSNLIKNIYSEYNSFNKYMLDLSKHYPDKFSEDFIFKMIEMKIALLYDQTNDNIFKIKHLRVIGNKLTDISKLIIRSHDAHTGLPNGYQTTINSVGLMIMKKKDNVTGRMPKYIRIPINTLNTHFNSNDLNILKHNFLKDKKFIKYLKEKQIDQNYDAWRILTPGTTLIKKESRELFYISSFQNIKDKSELKYIARSNGKVIKNNKEERIQEKLNDILDEYIILDGKYGSPAEPDVLGLNKILIDKYFK
ncbi:hypothetical protein ACNQ1T_03370, partial [Mycoplasma sp. 1932B]|uniref:hypothetical protein n=1 Tax=Mycoplasma sp. 1932B TaxID=3401670 RepID=UPI003AB09A1E